MNPGQYFQIQSLSLGTLHMGDNSSNSPRLPENKQLDQETLPFLEVQQGSGAPGTSSPSPRGTPRCRRRTAQSPLQHPARIPCNSCYAMPEKLKRNVTIVWCMTTKIQVCFLSGAHNFGSEKVMILSHPAGPHELKKISMFILHFQPFLAFKFFFKICF